VSADAGSRVLPRPAYADTALLGREWQLSGVRSGKPPIEHASGT